VCTPPARACERAVIAPPRPQESRGASQATASSLRIVAAAVDSSGANATLFALA